MYYTEVLGVCGRKGGGTMCEDLEIGPPIEKGFLYKETLREELVSF